MADFATPRYIAVGDGPRGVAVSDFNNDGKHDVAVANISSNNISVALGRGGGAFKRARHFAAGVGPQAVAIGDFNSDGNQDIASANGTVRAGSVSVLLGKGDGRFGSATTAIPGAHFSVSVVVGDFDQDSDLDLAIANANSQHEFGLEENDVSIMVNDGTGAFTFRTHVSSGGYGPKSIATADLNSDGKQDLVVADPGNSVQPGGTVSVLLGTGSANFGPPARFPSGGLSPEWVTIGYLNLDSTPDIAVANTHSDNVSVLLGSGAGVFLAPAPFPVGDEPWAVAIGNFNVDPHGDLAVANYADGTISTFRGDGSGAFMTVGTFSSGGGPLAVVFNDFNGDGRDDIAASNHLDDNVSVMLAAT